MALCFRIQKDIYITYFLFAVIVDFLSYASPHEQNQIVCTVVEQTSTLNEGILIPVSWYCLRWTMLETCAAPSRHQQRLTSGQRIVWSPTATEQSASTVREIIKATGEWWSELMSLWRKNITVWSVLKKQHALEKHVSVLTHKMHKSYFLWEQWLTPVNLLYRQQLNNNKKKHILFSANHINDGDLFSDYGLQ